MTNIRDIKLSDIENSPEMKRGEELLRVSLAVRIGEVDREATSELLMRAKGPQRSIRMFAEELNVNPSSLSRIANCKVNEISDALLVKIAEHADPDSGVTLDMLMRAQGLSDPQDKMISVQTYLKDCRRILVDELVQRGYTVKGAETEFSSNTLSPFRYDIALTTDALKNGTGKWVFDIREPRNVAVHVGSGQLIRSLYKAMAYFYEGHNEIQRISLVADSRPVFEQIKSWLTELSIPNEISVIFVNITMGRIEDEYVAPLSADGDPDAVFIKTDN